MRFIKYLLYFLIVPFIFSCGEENGFVPPVKEAEVLTLEGWTKFEYRSYSSYQNALTKFKDAIALDSTYTEAYSGAGWANARLTNLRDAVHYFTKCISLNSSHVDAHAGLAFVYNAQKQYQSSIESANLALNRDPKWVFAHDRTLSYSDLYLMKAECYFALGDFTSSLHQVQLLNLTFVVDINTYDGRVALAEEIERLRGIV